MVRMRHQATDQERENLGQTPGTDIIANNPGGIGKDDVYQDHILRHQQKVEYEALRNYLGEQSDFRNSVTGDNTGNNVTKTNTKAMEARGFNVNTNNNINVGVPTNNNRENYLKKLKFSNDNNTSTVMRKNNNRLNLYNR